MIQIRKYPGGQNLPEWRGWADEGDPLAREEIDRFMAAAEWANGLTDDEARAVETEHPWIFENWQVGSVWPLAMMQKWLVDAQSLLEAARDKVAAQNALSFNCPSLEETQRRMLEVYLQPEGARDEVTMPKSLAGIAPFVEEYYDRQSNGVNLSSAGELYRLRPRTKDTRQSLLDQIGELPQANATTFWERASMELEWPTPQVIGSDPPFQTYYLNADEEDTITGGDGLLVGLTRHTPWNHRSRLITPLGKENKSWQIGSIHPAFAWYFHVFPVGNYEYELRGTIESPHPGRPPEDGATLVRYCHPDRGLHGSCNPNRPILERPDDMSSLSISGSQVWGTAWLPIKKLGFMGALEVAINKIECLEWAYGLTARPDWLEERI